MHGSKIHKTRERTPDCNDVQVVITVICVGIKIQDGANQLSGADCVPQLRGGGVQELADSLLASLLLDTGHWHKLSWVLLRQSICKPSQATKVFFTSASKM